MKVKFKKKEPKTINFRCYKIFNDDLFRDELKNTLQNTYTEIIIIIIMVYRITGLSSLYDSLVCVAVWSNFIGSCLQYSSSLFLNALILIASREVVPCFCYPEVKGVVLDTPHSVIRFW